MAELRPKQDFQKGKTVSGVVNKTFDETGDRKSIRSIKGGSTVISNIMTADEFAELLKQPLPKPIASFLYGPPNGPFYAGQTEITFDGNGSTIPGSTKNFRWTIEGKVYVVNTATTIKHIFAAAGDYPVKLETSGGDGQWSDPFSRTVTIVAAPAADLGVVFLTPADGSTVSGAYSENPEDKKIQVNVTGATTADPVASVDFYTDGKKTNTEVNAPWSYVGDFTAVPAGPHIIKAIATSKSGKRTGVGMITVTVAAPAPTPTPTPTPDPTPPPVPFPPGPTVPGQVAKGKIFYYNPFYAYRGTARSVRIRALMDAPVDMLGGYAPEGSNVGVVTCTASGGTVKSVDSLGTGLVRGPATKLGNGQPLQLKKGEIYTLSCSGTVCNAEGDEYITATYHTQEGMYPDGDAAQLCNFPWPNPLWSNDILYLDWPIGVYNVNDQNVKDKAWFSGIRWMVPYDMLLWRFWDNLKAQGASWWSPVGSGYGKGDGGLGEFLVVSVGADGNPQLTNILGKETGISIKTRYDQSRAAVGTGATSQSFYAEPRTSAGKDVPLKRGDVICCGWRNVHSDPANNYFSTNRPDCHPKIAVIQNVNNLDKKAKGSIAGHGPMNQCVWTTDNGAHYYWGVDVGTGYYAGDRNSDDGTRVAQFGAQERAAA